MSAHTPGPWRSCQLGSGVLVGPNIGGKVGNVAVVYGGYGETAANVALIAAAPDLLAALEDAIRLELGEGYEGSNPVLAENMKRARAAIAKARGE